MTSESIDPYIAMQIAAREQSSVIKIKLLNMRSMYPEGLIIAIEGEDDKSVYARWIDRAAHGLRYEMLTCGGKRPARQLKNSLAADTNDLSDQVKIIVDRDFDDLSGFINADNVFMLERYSFENFLINTEVVERALAIAFPCNGLPQLREQISNIFDVDFQNFLMATRGLNERIYIARRLGINIDGAIPKSLDAVVEIVLEDTKSQDHDPSEILPFDIDSDVDIDLIKNEFAQLDPTTRYRGKFSWKFFTKWFDRLAHEYRHPQIGTFAAVPAGGRINHNELTMGAIAGFCPLPEGLGVFLLN